MIKNIKSQSDLSGFYIVYNGSVQNEKAGIRGISHLMEHLMYKGNKKLWNTFDNYGVDFNAFTSNTDVVFHITGLDNYINKFKTKFIEGLSTFKIDEKTFQNEKKVVIEEYYDSFSNPQESHYLNLNRKLYDNYSAIGSLNDLKKITLDDCYEYFENYLSKPTKIVDISKSYPYNNQIEFNNQNNYSYNPRKPFDYELEPTNQHLNKYSVIYTSPIIKKDFNKIDFLLSMLGFGLESPLFKILREKNGLVYGVSSSLDQLTNKQGVINISTSTNKPKLVNKVISHIFNNSTKYLNESRFNTIKKNYLINFKMDKINQHANIFPHLNNADWNVETIINQITLNEIHNIFNKYFNNFYVSIDKDEQWKK